MITRPLLDAGACPPLDIIYIIFLFYFLYLPLSFTLFYHPQDVAPSLISPDSGFISRHDDSPSMPFSSTLTECEYDGLNV